MAIGYRVSPTKTKTDILVASASCGVTVLMQQEYPHRQFTTVWCGVSYNERNKTYDRAFPASRTRVFLHGLLQPIRVFPRLENVNNGKE